MRIVLDTNVLISAFISSGICHELLEHCIRHHELVTSEFILDEFRTNLSNKFKFSDEEADEALELLRLVTEVVQPTVLEAQICRDPDDDRVLGTAIAGDADCIVSGDGDLQVLKRFQIVDILSPSEFQYYESGKA